MDILYQKIRVKTHSTKNVYNTSRILFNEQINYAINIYVSQLSIDNDWIIALLSFLMTEFEFFGKNIYFYVTLMCTMNVFTIMIIIIIIQSI